MDIDVNNAYNKAITACGRENMYPLLAQVQKFIVYISLTGAEDRFGDFCRTYVKKHDASRTLFVYSDELLFLPEVKDLLVVLGKYYLYSRSDKKEIDKQKYIEYINNLPDNLPVETKKDKLRSNGKSSASADQRTKQPQDTNETQEPEETLEELIDDLHSMIGLEHAKEEVDQLINLIRVRNKSIEMGLKQTPSSLHLVFYGNPGTGKTTVARKLAKIYKSLGVISKGHLTEVDRSDLVGGYVGQTAIKSKEVIERSLGGILFIDEAYTLKHGKGENDFGQEAIDTILKAMEDHRDDFVVIVAGYDALMEEFINSNPGLKSRFNQYIHFEDYKPDQLKDIFVLECSKQDLILSDGCEQYLVSYFTDLYNNRDANYANGRDVRNYFEKMMRARANRLSPILDTVSKDQVRTIILSDLENAKEMKNANW